MIDGHAHLEEVQDLSKALLEAKRGGVRAIIAVGMASFLYIRFSFK